MRKDTQERVSRLVEAAITDDKERDEVLGLLTGKKQERRDRLLKTKEAAKLAGCHVKSLFAWERHGWLHPKRITSRRIRWSRNELQDFLCEQAEG